MPSTSRFSPAFIIQAIPISRLRYPLGWRVRGTRNAVIQRRAMNIVSNNTSLSAGLSVRSPTRDAALTLPNPPFASSTRVEDASTSAELIWRARREPPDALGAIRRRSAKLISARNEMSNKRSPLCQVVPALPACLLASSTRAISLRHQDNELVGQVRKPPDASELWLLDEAINKTKRGTRWDCLPRSWPAYAHSPAAVSLLTSSAQVTEPCCWKDEPAWRVSKLPEVTKLWLLEEAINKIRDRGERSCSPASRPASALHARPFRFQPAFASHVCCSRREAFIVQHANGRGQF